MKKLKEKKDTAVELAGKVYDDGLKPAVKNAGGFFGALTGFFNHVVAAPLHKLNARFEIKTKAFINDLEKEYENIPVENRQEAPINILVPILDSLKARLDEEELKNMFTKLLKNSMDNRVSDKCHPAYVNVINQLSSNDARLLKDMANDKINNAVVYTKLKDKILDGIYQLNVIDGNYILALKQDDKQTEKLTIGKINKSISSLKRLGIIKIENADIENHKGENKIFKDLRDIQQEILKDLLSKDQNYYSSHTDMVWKFTSFGKEFIETCIGFNETNEDEPKEQNNEKN
ncbi:MAG: DUF4393 domain-containing protein [Firmicutes bacterium]|nr:DUF4393 domain-containing protein [Bacillota bacterium]